MTLRTINTAFFLSAALKEKPISMPVGDYNRLPTNLRKLSNGRYFVFARDNKWRPVEFSRNAESLREPNAP